MSAPSASAQVCRSTSTGGRGRADSILDASLASTATDFFTARREFEVAWREFSAKKTEDDYQEWRDHRDIKAEIRAKRARGERLDSEIPSSMMRCVCGLRFDSHKPDESYDHRAHIYAAQAEGRRW